MKHLLASWLLICALAGGARAEDKCRPIAVAALANQADNATVIYWDGQKRNLIRGPGDGDVVYLFANASKPTATDLGLADTTTAIEPRPVKDVVATGCKGGGLLYVTPEAVDSTDRSPKTPACEELDLAKANLNLVSEFRSPKCPRINANGATAVAAEAVQILGQIVVDRASQEAYRLVTTKAKKWLCGDNKTTRKLEFTATCDLLTDLRLQDLAMAPDQIRAALIKDVQAFIDVVKPKALGGVAAKPAAVVGRGTGTMHVVFAPFQDAKASSTQDCSSPARGEVEDLLCTIKRAILDRITPLLSRLPSSVGGHAPEVLVRQLVDKGLGHLQTTGDTKLCEVSDRRHRILATAAAAFAVCKITNPNDCAIMEVVDQLEDKCKTKPRPLKDYELGHARSIAGHFWDAVTLKKNATTGDHEKRLIAALQGTFETGCMYTITPPASTPGMEESDPYKCELTGAAGTEFQQSESLAILRDLVLAGAQRDGTALAASTIRALVRILPAADDKEQTKALRLLSTITSYAATYTSADAGSADAHNRRTALLTSLTRDMTVRADRDGDTIWSAGGSLRALGGFRYGRKETDDSMKKFRNDSVWAPLLPLGFAIDHICEKSNHGIHLELGLLDLGQYVTWDKGGKLQEPDLESALSASFTIAYSHGRSLPFIVGVTSGYTPSFDFDPDSDLDKKGAWNIGVTAGIYVPLFDFN